jgi:syntaxin 1B/2/3
MDRANSKFENTVSDLESRAEELRKLESSVNQVHQLFVQFAALINFQGEIIDNIYDNISQSKINVLVAEDHVIKSVSNMQSARKKKCCIIMIVCAIAVVIVGPTLGFTL